MSSHVAASSYSSVSSSPSSDEGGLLASQRRSVSHTLSKVLRHAAASMGLSLDSSGYARVDQLLALPCMMKIKPRPSLADLQVITRLCPKQRFHMMQQGNEWFIRANQGHGAALTAACKLDPMQLLTPLTLSGPTPIPPICVHGTTRAAWPLIARSGGLHPMSRSHIHFASAEFGEAKSGMRHTSEILIYVDIGECLRWAESASSENPRVSLEFFQSANGVLLTSGVNVLGNRFPSFLFDRVVEVQRDKGSQQWMKKEIQGWKRPTEQEWIDMFENGGSGQRNVGVATSSVEEKQGNAENGVASSSSSSSSAVLSSAHVSAEASSSPSVPASSSSWASRASPSSASLTPTFPPVSRWGPPPSSRPPLGWRPTSTSAASTSTSSPFS